MDVFLLESIVDDKHFLLILNKVVSTKHIEVDIHSSQEFFFSKICGSQISP